MKAIMHKLVQNLLILYSCQWIACYLYSRGLDFLCQVSREATTVRRELTKKDPVRESAWKLCAQVKGPTIQPQEMSFSYVETSSSSGKSMFVINHLANRCNVSH